METDTPFNIQGWQWRRTPEVRSKETLRFARMWEGTPHVAGARKCRVGVDCKELAIAYWDFLSGNDRPNRTTVPRIAQDSGLHGSDAAWGVLRAAVRAFSLERPEDGTIQPGDVIICRCDLAHAGQSNPGHAMVALPRKGTTLHAIKGPGVCQTSIDAIHGEVIQVLRIPPTQHELTMGET